MYKNMSYDDKKKNTKGVYSPNMPISKLNRIGFSHGFTSINISRCHF